MLLSCATSYRGELEHAVMIGLENESEYEEEFGERIKNTFAAGMEFNIGNVKNALTAEQKRLFSSAWMETSEQETKDEISCEMFGGTYCMWQWHMTFKQGSQVAYWNSPFTECTRGTRAPKHTPKNTIKAAPSVEMPAQLHKRIGFTNFSCGLLGLSMAITSCLVLSLRRSRIPNMILQEPLCAPSRFDVS
jgi:hypothetical protein